MTTPPRSFHARLWNAASRREARAVAAVIILLTVFVGLLLALRGSLLTQWDIDATRAFQRERNGPLDFLAEAFTFLGGYGVIAPFGCLIALGLLKQRPRTAVLLAAAALIGHPLAGWVKLIARRPRPTEAAVTILLHASGTSFPSGHALATMFLFGFLAVLAGTLLPSPGTRRAAAVACIVFVVGVGLSRVYVGGHWLSDVIGGWAVGLLLVLLWTEIHRVWAAGEMTLSVPQPGL